MFEDGDTADQRGSGSEGMRGREQTAVPTAGSRCQGCYSKGSAMGETQEPGSGGRRPCQTLREPWREGPAAGADDGDGGGLLFQPLFLETGLEKEGPSRE